MTIVVISDSYLKPVRINRTLSKGELSLAPHKEAKIPVLNLSKGSYTFEQLTSDTQNLKLWADARPQTTIVHCGACDIINKSFSISDKKSAAKDFVTLVENTVLFLVQFAEERISDFVQWQERHIFVIVQLPDWGEFEARPGSLTPQDYKEARRLINHQLKSAKGWLWGKRNALVVSPNTQHPHMKGVHFDTDTQDYYTKQIWEVIRKLNCSLCRPHKDAPSKQLANLRSEGCKKLELDI